MQKKIILDIEIAPSGKTQIHIKGMKGKKCLEVVNLFKDFLGEVNDFQRTSEYYEPDQDAEIKTRY